MNNILVVIIGLYILICPFYFFDSGVPQPAHYLVVIGFALVPFLKGFKTLFKEKIVIYLFSFLLLVVVVNTSYFFYFFKEDGFTSPFLFHTAYYVFNFGFFLLILYSLTREEWNSTSNKLGYFLILSLAIQVTLALMGVNKITQYIVTDRAVIYFNNPNQLGYYTLLLLTLFTVLPSKFKANNYIVGAMIFATICLGIYSSSRIVLIGLLLLSSLLVYEMGINVKYFVAAVIIGVLVTPFVYKTEFIQKKIELIEIRNHRQDTTGITEAQIRGYDRIMLHPKYLLVGAGEGKYDRFKSYQKGELHSGFGTLLFAYGIAGLALFFLFFLKALNVGFIYNIIVLSPILLYNLVHQGFRNPLFWGILAIIFVVNKKPK